MRKTSLIFLFAMFALISTATFAQEDKEQVVENTQQVTPEKVEIELSQLPEAVTAKLAESYADYLAEKAYKAMKDDKEIYYVLITKEGKTINVLLDAEGNILEEKEVGSM